MGRPDVIGQASEHAGSNLTHDIGSVLCEMQANPNLGISKKWDTMREGAREAANKPAELNQFLRWQDARTVARRIIEAARLADACDIILGLEAPDDGTLRRTASNKAVDFGAMLLQNSGTLDLQSGDFTFSLASAVIPTFLISSTPAG